MNRVHTTNYKMIMSSLTENSFSFLWKTKQNKKTEKNKNMVVLIVAINAVDIPKVIGP